MPSPSDFALPGAVERLLPAQIGVDLPGSERTELDARRDQLHLHAIGGGVEHGHRGVEIGAPAAQHLQLPRGTLVAAGLVEPASVELRDLVRADHDSLRIARNACPCLGLRQPQRGVGRRLVGPGGLVDAGRAHREREPKAREQLAAVGRGGGQHQHRNEARLRSRLAFSQGKVLTECKKNTTMRGLNSDSQGSEQGRGELTGGTSRQLMGPAIIDPRQFARERATVSGSVAAAALGRLADVLFDAAGTNQQQGSMIHYRVTGFVTPEDQPALRIEAERRNRLALPTLSGAVEVSAGGATRDRSGCGRGRVRAVCRRAGIRRYYPGGEPDRFARIGGGGDPAGPAFGATACRRRVSIRAQRDRCHRRRVPPPSPRSRG